MERLGIILRLELVWSISRKFHMVFGVSKDELALERESGHISIDIYQ